MQWRRFKHRVREGSAFGVRTKDRICYEYLDQTVEAICARTRPLVIPTLMSKTMRPAAVSV